MSNQVFQNATPNGQTLSKPGKPHPAKVSSKRPLPCYVILVHGVNDVGEAYVEQEKGICWGLSDRLDRNGDLQPFDYVQPDPKRKDPLLPEPDKVYYRRVPNDNVHTPVIPFYWGFREEDDKIQKDDKEKNWHGQWLDRHGNRIDKDGAKNGGAFVNASNCLPHMWGPGWKPPLPGKRTTNTLKNAFSGDDRIHPFLEAGERRYQVLAALRLAMLVRMIRERHPESAINVVAHSMGCCVSLLAQAFLAEGHHPLIDTLILNNPPYSFEEVLLDKQMYGNRNQTSHARIETLQRIVKATYSKRKLFPSLQDILKPRPEGKKNMFGKRRGIKKEYGTKKEIEFPERDNRGKIYLYFTPHDQTVALLNQQGIGWQGVPDEFTEYYDDPKHSLNLAQKALTLPSHFCLSFFVFIDIIKSVY